MVSFCPDGSAVLRLFFAFPVFLHANHSSRCVQSLSVYFSRFSIYRLSGVPLRGHWQPKHLIKLTGDHNNRCYFSSSLAPSINQSRATHRTDTKWSAHAPVCTFLANSLFELEHSLSVPIHVLASILVGAFLLRFARCEPAVVLFTLGPAIYVTGMVCERFALIRTQHK